MSGGRGVPSSLLNRIDIEVARLKDTRLKPAVIADGEHPDPAIPWIPETLVPLWGTAGYKQLSDEQRLRYNHYYALQMLEQFIWIENALALGPLRMLLAGTRKPGLVRIIQSFIADEVDHSAALWELANRARPDLYCGQHHLLFQPPARVRFLAFLMGRFPSLLSGWTLFLNVLEEHTLVLHREYKQAGNTVDSLFARIHFLHAQDEARHCSMDSLLGAWLIEGQTGWQQQLNARALEGLMAVYYDTDWGWKQSLEQLVKDFPELRDDLSDLLRDASSSRGRGYLEHLFDSKTVPITTRNRNRHTMLDQAVTRVLRRAS